MGLVHLGGVSPRHKMIHVESSPHTRRRASGARSRPIGREFRNLPQPCAGSPDSSRELFRSAVSPTNVCKNRYPDVLPFESTRVRLRSSSDYINASYIAGEHEKSYISCQAPLPSTFEDFWRMIWVCGYVPKLIANSLLTITFQKGK